MKKTILTFGVISGVISTLLMLTTMLFADKIGFDKGEIVGYTSIVLSFLLVFFGIRSYRDNIGNGQITFGKAFTIGILITLVSCVFYVATWEILYFNNFFPGFIDKYNAHEIQKLQESGASQAVIQAQLKAQQKLKQMYDNPLINSAMTFLEPFPVGLLITLISAAILRRRPRAQPAQAVVA